MSAEVQPLFIHNAAIDELMTAMREQGIEPSDPLKLDGTLERFHVAGDKKGSTNGWATIHLDAKPAGVFGCNKRHGLHKFSWKANRATEPMSAADLKTQRADWNRRRIEQDAATNKRRADTALRAQALWDAAKPATDDHPYLARKGVKSHGLRVGKWELINKDTGEVRTLTKDALYVPLCDKTRAVHSLQGIFPGKILGKGEGARDKDYLKDGAKRGLFHAIGKPQKFDGRPVFVICEGYATGATLHEASNHLVLVTFDTSNLLAVGKAIRESKPDAIILFAADNDQWTVTPTVTNPGRHFAREAVKAVKGLLAVPPFTSADGVQDGNGKWSGPTDFNDLAARDGNPAVAAIIEAALVASLTPEPEYLPADDEPQMPWDSDDYQQSPEALAPAFLNRLSLELQDGALTTIDDKMTEKTVAPGRSVEPDADGQFAILGYDRATIYIYSHRRQQILTATSSSLSKASGLIELAPMNWWESYFQKAGRGGMGLDAVAAADWVLREAEKRGIYDPTLVRGRGVWVDDDHLVFHHGNYLSVNGETKQLNEIRSRFVYEGGPAIAPPAKTDLTDEEGAALIETASRFRWANSGSGMLLAGWAFLAPVCGALRWRSHIWITGAAGSGKSTLMDHFLACLMPEGWLLHLQGNSTEAGIRQRLKADARPVLIDEFESNTEVDAKRIESVLTLIRQSSSESGAEVARGTVSGQSLTFHIRSAFCLASVGVSLNRQTDVDRLTKLELRGDSVGDWENLERELATIKADRTYSQRLFARALHMLLVIRDSAAVFTRSAGKHFGTQRDGDQFGTLLAGCWCLQKSYVPNEQEAVALIESQDWTGLGAGASLQNNDSSQVLDALLVASIRIDSVHNATVGELLRIVRAGSSDGNTSVTPSEAHDVLQRHGIRISPDFTEVMFAKNNKALLDLVQGTALHNDLLGRLARIKGGRSNNRNERQRFASTPLMFVALPTGAVFGTGAEFRR